LQEDTISTVLIFSSGENYVAGDLVVLDELGGGSGCVAQFTVNNVTGAVERYITFFTFIASFTCIFWYILWC
jgi:hypothetical protein